MSRRSRRGLINKTEVLQKLQTGRAGAVQVCAQAEIGSKEYKLAGYVQEAIDDLADKLTGDREVFWSGAATTPAREDSEKR
ncbi:hypothetical protein [Labrenzia sp. OB1]|uniref:hypothetical protein n=1 Tax=Labrenzia sp. OB1 TaxID=1561204 RepID=UPI0007B26458|nr:hypothetical protein [Labrenzia sp. OB1]KZM49164.1 hypothetical protein OA90_17105 [Labrenzia sp. OB1]